MKLIELLVQETLNGNFKWPYGVNKIHQDYDGELRPDCGFCNLYIKVVAENHRELGVPGCDLDDEFFVTREQYEAALAQTEWSGVGLPPVGCECEVRYRHGGTDWGKFKCLAIDRDIAFGWCADEPVTLPDDCYEFRPILSEADKKRDELQTAFRTCLAGTGAGITPLAAKCLYDAIAAGKIPGLKLSD